MYTFFSLLFHFLNFSPVSQSPIDGTKFNSNFSHSFSSLDTSSKLHLYWKHFIHTFHDNIQKLCIGSAVTGNLPGSLFNINFISTSVEPSCSLSNSNHKSHQNMFLLFSHLTVWLDWIGTTGVQLGLGSPQRMFRFCSSGKEHRL